MVLPVEVKSGKHYKRHRALNRVMSQAEYGIKEAIVFDDSALKVENGVFYAPVYMAMFLKKDELPDKMIYTVGTPLEFDARAAR